MNTNSFAITPEVYIFLRDLYHAGHSLETRVQLFKNKYPEAWDNTDIRIAMNLDALLCDPRSNFHIGTPEHPFYVNTGVNGTYFRKNYGNPGITGTNHYFSEDDIWMRITASGIFTFDFETFEWDLDAGCWMFPSRPWREGTTIPARPVPEPHPPSPISQINVMDVSFPVPAEILSNLSEATIAALTSNSESPA